VQLFLEPAIFLCVIKFDLGTATTTDFDDYLGELALELAEHEAHADRTRRRIKWVSEGRALYEGTASVDRSNPDKSGVLSDQYTNVVKLSASREASTQTKPHLRQAILSTMIERQLDDGREPEWRAKDVIARLKHAQWMPNGVNAEGMVRNMLRNMASRDELERPSYGSYRLSAHIRAASSSLPKSDDRTYERS
jgi:hypothetical protein